MDLFRKTKVDEIHQREKEIMEKEEKVIEDLKLVCADIFSSKNGMFFLKYLFKMCFWAEQDININNEVLLYKKGRRDTWAIIRNVIPKDILAQVEIYDS